MSTLSRHDHRPIDATTSGRTAAGAATVSDDTSGPFISCQPRRTMVRAALQPGLRLDRFTIKRHVDAGSHADIYEAHDAIQNHTVAIKVVTDDREDPGGAGAQLRGQIEAYRKIDDNRHIVKVHDLHPITCQGMPLLALSMELAEGGSFRQWLQRHVADRPKRHSEGMRFIRQVCLGLAAVHDAGLLHLDLKPENIVQVGGVWKLADLGCSSSVGHPVEGQESGESERAATSGTPVYMPPEAFEPGQADDLDVRADIYAVGVILYEILHPQGRLPFTGNTNRLRHLHTHGRIRIPDTVGVPEARAIRRCLEKDPELRYASVAELVEELDGQPAQSVARLDAKWREAQQMREDGLYPEALELAQQLLTLHPERQDIQDMAQALQRRSERARTLYAAVDSGMDQLGLGDLLDLLEEAVGEFPGHPMGRVVQARLAARGRQYRLILEGAAAKAAQGDWDAARIALEQAAQISPTDGAVYQALQIAQHVCTEITAGRQEIDRAAAMGNWARADRLAQTMDHWLRELRGLIDLRGGVP